MEKAKLKYIEEQCNRIANGMERLSGFTGTGQLHLYEHLFHYVLKIKNEYSTSCSRTFETKTPQIIIDTLTAVKRPTVGRWNHIVRPGFPAGH